MALFYEQNLVYVLLGNGKQNFMTPGFFYSFQFTTTPLLIFYLSASSFSILP
jgi:hypothetical protein